MKLFVVRALKYINFRHILVLVLATFLTSCFSEFYGPHPSTCVVPIGEMDFSETVRVLEHLQGVSIVAKREDLGGRYKLFIVRLRRGEVTGIVSFFGSPRPGVPI